MLAPSATRIPSTLYTLINERVVDELFDGVQRLGRGAAGGGAGAGGAGSGRYRPRRRQHRQLGLFEFGVLELRAWKPRGLELGDLETGRALAASPQSVESYLKDRRLALCRLPKLLQLGAGKPSLVRQELVSLQ